MIWSFYGCISSPPRLVLVVCRPWTFGVELTPNHTELCHQIKASWNNVATYLAFSFFKSAVSDDKSWHDWQNKMLPWVFVFTQVVKNTSGVLWTCFQSMQYDINWKCALLRELGWVCHLLCDNLISACFLSVFCSWAVQMNCSCNPVTIVVHLVPLDDRREDASVFYFDICWQTLPCQTLVRRLPIKSVIICILLCLFYCSLGGGLLL